MSASQDKIGEIVRYTVVGILTTLVSLGSYFFVTVTILDARDGFQLQVATILSWVCAVSFAYVANRRIVFRSREQNILKEASKFFGARMSTLVIEMLCMGVFVTILNLNDAVAKLLVQIIVFILNYLMSKVMVFRKSSSH